MSLDDATLREAFAARQRDDADAPVDPDEVWAAVSGELDAERVGVLVDRLARDPALATEWRLARELGAAPSNVVSLFPFRAVAIGLALAAAAVLTVWVVIDEPTAPPSTELRGDGARIRAELPAGAVSRDAAHLRWTAIPGATYEVRVFDEALGLLHEEKGLTEPAATVPAASLADEGVVLWQVTARVPGRDPIRSPTFRLSIR